MGWQSAATLHILSRLSKRLEIPLNLGGNRDMGYSIFLEAMLEIALSLFPLFKGSSKRDADVKRSQNDPEEIYLVPFLG